MKNCSESQLEYRIWENDVFIVETAGVRATIIDFSLSRLTLDPYNLEAEGGGGQDIFNNLSEDPDLFTAQGDYQFEIYRYVYGKIQSLEGGSKIPSWLLGLSPSVLQKKALEVSDRTK